MLVIFAEDLVFRRKRDAFFFQLLSNVEIDTWIFYGEVFSRDCNSSFLIRLSISPIMFLAHNWYLLPRVAGILHPLRWLTLGQLNKVYYSLPSKVGRLQINATCVKTWFFSRILILEQKNYLPLISAFQTIVNLLEI